MNHYKTIISIVSFVGISLFISASNKDKTEELKKIVTNNGEFTSRMSDKGKNVRGIYIPPGMARRQSPADLVRGIREIKANAVILDVKDDLGRVAISKKLPYAKGRPHGYNNSIKNILKRLKDHDIYTIARVVCFKDNLLAHHFPEAAILDKNTKKPWKDQSGHRWTDPYSSLAHEHIVAVAVAAQEMGFDEIQLDYIRFPVEPKTRDAEFPNRKKSMSRTDAIVQLLKKVRKETSIPISVDVFGLTAYRKKQSMYLGQALEQIAPHVDAISPMVYLANWPADYYENPTPLKTYTVIKGAILKMRERLGEEIVIRPLLQGFKWRADNWGPAFVANQIDASLNGGSNGYLFWNAGGNYRVVRQVFVRIDKKEKEEEEKE